MAIVFSAGGLATTGVILGLSRQLLLGACPVKAGMIRTFAKASVITEVISAKVLRHGNVIGDIENVPLAIGFNRPGQVGAGSGAMFTRRPFHTALTLRQNTMLAAENKPTDESKPAPDSKPSHENIFKKVPAGLNGLFSFLFIGLGGGGLLMKYYFDSSYILAQDAKITKQVDRIDQVTHLIHERELSQADIRGRINTLDAKMDLSLSALDAKMDFMKELLTEQFEHLKKQLDFHGSQLQHLLNLKK